MHQRSHYRTTPDPWQNIEVAVIDREGLFPGQLLDMSGTGIGVAFEKDVAPSCELGSSATVQLTLSEFAAPIHTPVIVVRAENDGDKRVFGMQFVDWLGLADAVPKNISWLFNLRSDPRLPMDPAKPVPVKIRADDESFDLMGVLCDVSRSGFSFSTELQSQCILNRVSHVIAEFQLPVNGRSLVFGSRIRYRNLVGESLRYGLWFDLESTENFEAQQVYLGEYVEQRLAAALKTVCLA